MISLGQVPLLVFALTVLMILQMSINASILSSAVSSLDNEATIEATTLGNLMLGEVKSKAFDSNALDQTGRPVMLYNRSQLTPASSLGPESSFDSTITNEIVPVSQTLFLSWKYKDIDDYNRYVRTVQTQNLATFVIRDSICYVQESNPEAVSSTQTWCKMVVVTVTHPNMSNPVIIKSLIAYTRS